MMETTKKKSWAQVPQIAPQTRLGAPDSPKIPQEHRRLEGWGALRPPVPRVLFLSLAGCQSKIWRSLAKPGPARHEMIAEDS